MAFNRKGQWVVTASADKTARLWDVSSGKELAVLAGHLGGVRHAAFSPDGRWIVTASADHTARLWDSYDHDPRALEYSRNKGRVNYMVMSPDGRHRAMISEDGGAFLLDTDEDIPPKELEGHDDRVLYTDFSHKGQWIVTTSADYTARLWEVSSGELHRELKGHQDDVLYAAFSADDQYVVTASADTCAIVWNVHTGALITVLSGHHGPVSHAAFSRDGRHVVTASDDYTARLWTIGDGAPHSVLLKHNGPVKRVSFSDDNAHVITVSGNDLIRLWDINDGHMIAVFPGFDATFDHYGQLAIVVSENVTRFWTPFLPTQNLQDEAYRRVRQLDPEQRKQFALKVAEKSSANRQTPENFLLDYHKLGDIYMDTGEVEEAVKAYQQQTKIKPQDGDAWNDLGDALRHQDKLEEAKKAFAAGLKAQSTHLRLLSNDAELALIQGDITRLQDRIKKIPKEEIRNQQLSVILPFLAWLAHPKQVQAWEELKEALQQLPPGVPINWDFSNIDPVLAHLAPPSQQRAQYLVTFFKRWNKPQTRISPQILIEQLDAIQ